MASQGLADTAKEGDGENDIDNDIGTWLNKYRLNKLKDKFINDQVMVSDFLQYNENDIKEICEEYKMGFVVGKRFADAVRELQHASSQRNTSSETANQVYRIVVSTKESQFMSVLQDKLNDIDVAIENNTKETNESLENTQNTENDIKSAFNTFRNKINEREKLLITKLNHESNKQMDELKIQKNNLDQYKKSIKTAQKEQNKLVLDPNLDALKRQNKIQQITNDTINNINDDDMKISTASISFIVDHNAVNKYISSVGIVSGQPEPPRLMISDIGVTNATVTLESNYNKNEVKYSIRYRKENDDEKKGDWNEVNIDNDNNQYKLTNLRQKTAYQICGKYQTLKQNICSKRCASKSFTTRKLVYPPFEWDGNKKHNDISISNNNLTISTTAKTNRLIVAKNLLSASEIASVEWEITMKQIPQQPISGRLCMSMGYVTAEHTPSFTQWLGANEHQAGFYLRGKGRFHKYHKGSSESKGTTDPWDEKWTSSESKVGDKIELKFDFDNKACTVYYNSQMVGILMNNLPNSIYPAFSVAYSHTFECTKWIVRGR